MSGNGFRLDFPTDGDGEVATDVHPEFKVQAVKLVTEPGKSIAEVARDLDLGESVLRGWKQASPQTGHTPSPATAIRPPWRRSCAAFEPRTNGS